MRAPYQLLPERVSGPGELHLRRWSPGDAAILTGVVVESLEHLRPWMGWIAQEPLTVEQRRSMLTEFERHWRDGGDVVLGIFLEGHAVGGCGLHRRIAPDGLELGYWMHPGFTRRGLATAAARLLTDTALELPGITHVEIHHDKANIASAGIPRKLGFSLLAEVPDEVEAPAEIGIECQWRMDRKEWVASSQPTAAT